MSSDDRTWGKIRPKALPTTRTIEEAAGVVRVFTKTLLRLMKESEFDIAYRAAKRAAFGQSIARLHHPSNAAVTTPGKVMLEPGTPPATRIRADSILNHTTRAIEIEDIEARVAQLEQAAEAAAITGSLAKRLEHLETHLAPPSDEPAMVIRTTRIGHLDRIIEVRGDNTADRRRQPWSPRRRFKGMESRTTGQPKFTAPL